MKELSIFRRYYRFYIIILFLFILLSLWGNAYGNVTNNKEDFATLHIILDEKNNVTGELILNRQHSQIKDVETSYIIFPFEISQASADDDTINVTSKNDGNYALLNIITAKNSPSLIKINFQITPLIVDSTQIPYDQDAQPDFFLLEQRGDAHYTFHFRFDTQIADKPFENLTGLTKDMIIPSQIIIDFPKDAVFFTIPPHDYEAYNIYDSNYPGIYKANTFITSIDFYQKIPLHINYSLPQPLPPISNILILIILALSLFIPTMLSFPEEMLSERLRVRFSTIIAVAIPLTLIIIGVWNGTNFLTNYLAQKNDLLIPGIISYFISIILLILRNPFIRQILIFIRQHLRYQPISNIAGITPSPQTPPTSGITPSPQTPPTSGISQP